MKMEFIINSNWTFTVTVIHMDLMMEKNKAKTNEPKCWRYSTRSTDIVTSPVGWAGHTSNSLHFFLFRAAHFFNYQIWKISAICYQFSNEFPKDNNKFQIQRLFYDYIYPPGFPILAGLTYPSEFSSIIIIAQEIFVGNCQNVSKIYWAYFFMSLITFLIFLDLHIT